MGAAYAVNPNAEALEKRLSEVLDPKENGKAGLKLLSKVQWDDSVKSAILHRIVRIVQREMFVNFAIFRSALLSEDELKECVGAIVADENIEETLIPFDAVTTNLTSGNQLIDRKSVV